ncbi:hypothetical protein Cgig2_004434 [Carnegiea gigantea]|uniref:Peptidase C1A papain C-terminal domain-containing protein n=1 Tax=Carnegiea gigantea TaxID=171969 RepID=A0A9Q1JV19_9CARY|nr:hypothetical protein Cgig2_004434 [Carnegiea gigantea]
MSVLNLLDPPVLATESLPKLKLNSKILQEDIVNKINADPTAGWKAGLNDQFSNYTVGQFKHLLGARPIPLSEARHIPIVSHGRSLHLPKEFDARQAWPQCSTISRILVNDLLACCGFLCGSGCNGGIPLFAWRYFVHHGVVTEECDPYFDSTGCSHPGCEPAYPTPKCVRKCADGNQLWKASKHYGQNAYKIHAHPDDIMAELYKNGPVEVSFNVYEIKVAFGLNKMALLGTKRSVALFRLDHSDFAHYKSGVYKHVTGDYLGGHAVKLIGWGTTADGEDYWDGYFKIRRGTNECGIEHGAVAGMPSSRNLNLIDVVGGTDSAGAASV